MGILLSKLLMSRFDPVFSVCFMILLGISISVPAIPVGFRRTFLARASSYFAPFQGHTWFSTIPPRTKMYQIQPSSDILSPSGRFWEGLPIIHILDFGPAQIELDLDWYSPDTSS